MTKALRSRLLQLKPEEINILIEAIRQNKNMKVIKHQDNRYSVLNLAAAHRVMMANPDIFPTDDTDWLSQNVDEWFKGYLERDTIRTVRYGLLSGFPRNAAIKYYEYHKALQKIGVKSLFERENPVVRLLLPHPAQERSGNEKRILKEKIEGMFPDILSPAELNVLVDVRSNIQGIEGGGSVGFLAFSEEDRIWTEQVMAIHNKALGKDSFKIWGAAPPLDAAMTRVVEQEVDTGGIDFKSDKMNVQTQNSNGEIKFNIDRAMSAFGEISPNQRFGGLQQLQNASGFEPKVIKIESMADLRSFLETPNT